MGIVEVLVHAYDIAKGLELDWRPPSTLCAPALQRLFPGAPEGDASQVLLHLTGRQALAGTEKLTDWSWDSSVRSDPAQRRPDLPRRCGPGVGRAGGGVYADQ